MMCVALKDFTAAGEEVVRNQLIDASQFRNASNLVTSRYLRPATPDEIENAEEEDAPVRPAPPEPKKKARGLKIRRSR